MRVLALVSIAVFCSLAQVPANAASDEIEEAIKLIVTFCVAGGESVKIVGSGEVEGGFALKRLGVGAEGTIEFTSEESRGLAQGLQDEINKFAAGQQSEARECMRPYIDRFLAIMIGAKEAELPVTQTVIRTQWFSSEPITVVAHLLFEASKGTACVRSPDGWSLRPETAHFDQVELGEYSYSDTRFPSTDSPSNSSVVCADLAVGGPPEIKRSVTAVLKVQGFRNEGLHFE